MLTVLPTHEHKRSFHVFMHILNNHQCFCRHLLPYWLNLSWIYFVDVGNGIAFLASFPDSSLLTMLLSVSVL